MALACQPLWPQGLPAFKVYRAPPPSSYPLLPALATPLKTRFCIKISASPKMPLRCHLVPKVLQSDPKGLQNGALGGHLGDFFCKKPTLHPTAYLLCFRHILEVLGSPVLRKYLLGMCVGSRSPKKAVIFSLFSSLGENVSKWVPKWEGE